VAAAAEEVHSSSEEVIFTDSDPLEDKSGGEDKVISGPEAESNSGGEDEEMSVTFHFLRRFFVCQISRLIDIVSCVLILEDLS